MTLKNRITADFRRKNPGSTGFQGALALPDPPDCESGWMQRALRADSQSPPASPPEIQKDQTPFLIRKIRGNLSHPRYQRRILREDDVNSRFDEAKVRLT